MLHSCAATCKCFFHTAASSPSQDQGLDLVETGILALEGQPASKFDLTEDAKITKSPERSRSNSHDLKQEYLQRAITNSSVKVKAKPSRNENSRWLTC
jgi:hypothetical protein